LTTNTFDLPDSLNQKPHKKRRFRPSLRRTKMIQTPGRQSLLSSSRYATSFRFGNLLLTALTLVEVRALRAFHSTKPKLATEDHCLRCVLKFASPPLIVGDDDFFPRTALRCQRTLVCCKPGLHDSR